MVQATSCQHCGAATDSESLDGLCGRCLATVAFTAESPDEIEEGPAAQTLAALNKTIILDTSALRTEAKPAGRFGDYELIAEIARGGMGVVYKARQRSLNRIVAVKMILNARFNNPEFVHRFRAEAEAAAHLRHPNIVAIYEIGEEEGQHYFSMEYIEGRDLASLVREQALPPQAAAEHVRTIAEAIHYAHQCGVLHRDLKPSNVLVDANGEVRITDFGLAKRITPEGDESGVDLTVSGQVLGSPSYMSPEQAAGKSRHVDTRSDVYALGAILYTLVTGRPPFMADTVEATLLHVLQTEPVSPRLINPRVPKDFETICLKCLQKEPQRRYASAQAIADELGRFINREPIHARPLSLPAKVGRWCRRNPKLAGVTALAVTALLVISIGSPFVAYRLNAARVKAEKGELEARHSAYAADMSVVHESIGRRNFAHALHLLRLHRPRPNQADVRGWEWRYFWQQCQSDEITTLARHSSEVSALTISKRGQWLGSRDAQGNAKIVRLADGVEKLSVPGRSGPAPAFSPDERVAAIAGARGRVDIYDLATFTPLAVSLEHQASVEALAFSPDGTQIATYSAGLFRAWDWTAGRELERHSRPVGGRSRPVVNHASILPNARGIITSDDNQQARIWTVDGGAGASFDSEHMQTGGKAMNYCVSADGRLVATASALVSGGGYTIQIWDAITGRRITFFAAHTSFITSLAFSPGDRYLASTSTDQTTCIWDTRTWRQNAVLKGHNTTVSAVAFLPDERTAVTGGADGTVKTWDLTQRAGADRRIELSELMTAEMIGEFRGAISPDRTAMIMIDTNGTGTLVDLSAVKVAREFTVPEAKIITKVALSAGGEILACARRNGVLSLSVMPTLAPIADLPLTSTQAVRALAFSRDGRWLAGPSASGVFQLWSIGKSAREVSEWRARVTGATGICFSPDDRALACGHFDGSISLWNIESGQRLAKLQGHKKAVVQLAFSGDGLQIGSTSHDASARVWDWRTQAQLASFEDSQQNFYRVSFSPDGTRLLVNEFGDTLIFDIAAQRQLVRINSFIPYFIDEDTLLGMGRNELWTFRPPKLADIDAMESR